MCKTIPAVTTYHCDRCDLQLNNLDGPKVSHVDEGYLVSWRREETRGTDLDLCPTCYQGLLDYLKGSK